MFHSRSAPGARKPFGTGTVCPAFEQQAVRTSCCFHSLGCGPRDAQPSGRNTDLFDPLSEEEEVRFKVNLEIEDNLKLP
jgi:hypothetical protein